MTELHYAAVIIGSGQAAGPLAIALAKAGQRVALIERVHVGGVKLDKHGFIVVNERLETSAPGVYALGDVKG